MFAACFMILLIFLSLAQRADAPQPRPIEATEQLNLVTRPIPAPGGLVDLLHDHASTGGTSIDIFADRIDMLTAAGRTTLRGGAIGPAVAVAEAPIRLYVFSNVLYHDAAAALGDRAATEMSVPHALGTADGWRPKFLALDAERAELPVFRQRLAQLLEGGTEEGATARGGGGAPALSTGTALLQRLAATLAAIVAIGFPLLGLGAVVLIERRRFRSGQSIPVRGQSLKP
jgi:hypothetical protein